MTQRKLFIGAAALTLALGAVLFVSSSQREISADVSTQNTTGNRVYVVNQLKWQGSQGTTPLIIDSLKSEAPENWNQFWKNWMTGTFPGRGSTMMVRPAAYSVAQNVTVGNVVKGKNGNALQSSYLISSPMQLSGNRAADWQQIALQYQGKKGEFEFYYRVADGNGTTDPRASDWQQVGSLNINGKSHTAKIAVNKTGKTFQYKVHLSKTTNQIATVIVSLKPNGTVATSPNTSPNTTPGVGTSPDPSASPVAGTHKKVAIRQALWSAKSNDKIVTIDTDGTPVDRDKRCGDDRNEDTQTYNWNNYLAVARAANLEISKTKGELVGKLIKEKISQSYLISQAYTLDGTQEINWTRMKIMFKQPLPGTITLYYRTFDDPSQATDSPTSSSWIQVSDPNTLDVTEDDCTNSQIAAYRIEKKAKYFQYKVHVSMTKVKGKNVKQEVRRVSVFAEQGNSVVVTPSPNPSSSVTPSPVTSGGNGTITVLTRYMPLDEDADDSNATPSPAASGPALPELTPSPNALPSVDPSQPHPGCDNSDPAVDVKIKLKQLTGGSTRIEDEQTDEDGQWRGLNGGVDQFPSGSYDLSFGDFEKNDYKLVAYCVIPDDGQHHLKTQADPSTGKITILVKPGSETKVIALYGARTRPYISMNKFAIDAKSLQDATSKPQKVLRVIYPGQSFIYRIKYKNTSDTDAKNVLIQDVIPSEFEIPDEVLNDENDTYGLTVGVDAQRRTLIKKLIPEIKKGEEGSIYIPVTLRADAFVEDDL